MVKFKARGPYKCVTVNGHARTGMHPALFKAIGSGFDYNKAKATNTLQVVAMPPASEFYPLDEATKNTRTLAYSAKQGQRLDTQESDSACTSTQSLVGNSYNSELGC